MKYTIKNRPKRMEYTIKNRPKVKGRYTWATEDWFSGFEKELRERMKNMKRFKNSLMMEAKINMIKEILGDV